MTISRVNMLLKGVCHQQSHGWNWNGIPMMWKIPVCTGCSEQVGAAESPGHISRGWKAPEHLLGWGSTERDRPGHQAGLPCYKPSNRFAIWNCKKLQKYSKETTPVNTIRHREDLCLGSYSGLVRINNCLYGTQRLKTQLPFGYSQFAYEDYIL